jgi:hypothetical protein
MHFTHVSSNATLYLPFTRSSTQHQGMLFITQPPIQHCDCQLLQRGMSTRKLLNKCRAAMPQCEQGPLAAGQMLWTLAY